MKLRKPLIITAIALTSLVASGASPASAADTTVTFELTVGPLTVAVQPTAALSDEQSAGVGANQILGNLGTVTVTDDRGVAVVWTASAATTGFTGDDHGSVSTTVSYMAGEIEETGSITVADTVVPTFIDGGAAVVSPTVLSGNNTASWEPDLVVTMEPTALADTYTGIIVTSVV